MMVIQKAGRLPDAGNMIILCSAVKALSRYGLTPSEIAHVQHAFETEERKSVSFSAAGRHIVVQRKDKKDTAWKTVEALRKSGATLLGLMNENKAKTVTVADTDEQPAHLLAFAEGMALAAYQFLKYKKNAAREKYSLTEIALFGKNVKAADTTGPALQSIARNCPPPWRTAWSACGAGAETQPRHPHPDPPLSQTTPPKLARIHRALKGRKTIVACGNQRNRADRRRFHHRSHRTGMRAGFIAESA